MVVRTLRRIAWSIIGFVAIVIGAGWGLLRTAYGRDLVARVVEERGTAFLDGSLSIGGLSGSFWTSLILSDVVIRDRDSSEVVRIARIEAHYRPDELLGGAVRLRQLIIRSPSATLSRDTSGIINLVRILGIGRRPEASDTTPPRLIVLDDVAVHEAEASLDLDDGQPRFIRGVSVALRSLRLSSPAELGIAGELAHFAGELSDPAIQIGRMSGSVFQNADSVTFDLDALDFGSSRASARGALRWGGGLAFDATIDGQHVAFEDIAFVDEILPNRGSATADIHLHLGERGDIRVDVSDLSYRDGDASLAGVIRVDVGAGTTRLRDIDVEAESFDLDIIRTFIPGLPFDGWLTGRVRLQGPLDSLGSEFDVRFRDRLPGNPVTFLTAAGIMRASADSGLTFDSINVSSAAVATETVRGFVPGFTLLGQIGAFGTVSGPLRNVRFVGTLEHRDGELPVSVIRGRVRLDTRGEQAVFEGDVVVEPLDLRAIRRGYPSIPVEPALQGSIRFFGPLSAMELEGDVSLGEGRVSGKAVVMLGDSLQGVRDVDLVFDRADPAALGIGAPNGSMSMTVHGSVFIPAEGLPTGQMEAIGGASTLAAALLDTLVIRTAVNGGAVHFSELRGTFAGLDVAGSGSLPWRGGGATAFELHVVSDTLAPVESLARWLLKPDIPPEEVGPALDGRASVTIRVSGRRDSLDVSIEGFLAELAWLDLLVLDGKVDAELTVDSAVRFDIDATADSVVFGRWGAQAVRASVSGWADSLHWYGRTNLGRGGDVLGGGWLTRDADTTVIAFDSLAMLAPEGVWVLQEPVRVTRTVSAWTIDNVAITPVIGPGRVTMSGRVPTAGRADWRFEVHNYPIVNAYDMVQLDTAGIDGRVNLTIQGAGTAREPLMRATLELLNGRFGAFRAPALDGVFGYENRELDGTLTLWGNVDRTGDRVVAMSVTLPLDLAFTHVAMRRLPNPLEIRARADGVDMSVLEALAAPIRSVSGQLDADVGITGTWDAPALTGELQITDGAASYPALNARHRNVQGLLRLHGDTIGIERMSLRSGSGSLAVTGYVRLLELTQPWLDLGLDARRFRAIDLPDKINFTASGRLRFRGPFIGGRLTGNTTIDEGVLYFADLVSKRIVNLEDPGIQALFEEGELAGQRLEAPLASRFLDSLRIDSLNLNMGNDVWLRSNEANIQLAGQLRAAKAGRTYRLDGTLNAARGTYRLDLGPADLPLASRRFEVTRGDVRFLGTPDFNADLDIEAQHVVRTVNPQETQQEITILARIRGTLLVPELSLSTDLQAPLTDREIISYLIFGQPDPGSGQGEAWIVEQIAGSLSGELERWLVSDLRIPLDYVDINIGSYNSPYGIAGGWQLNRKLFLVFGTGFCAPSSRGRQTFATRFNVGAQYRISPDFRTELSVRPVGSCLVQSIDRGTLHQLGIDVFFDKSY